MTIYAIATDPGLLLDKIKKKIDAGDIVTWEYDGVGDFTHTSRQWNEQAWLRPDETSLPGYLQFKIVKNTAVPMTRALHAIYQGRFIEMLLTHFPKTTPGIGVTPTP